MALSYNSRLSSISTTISPSSTTVINDARTFLSQLITIISHEEYINNTLPPSTSVTATSNSTINNVTVYCQQLQQYQQLFNSRLQQYNEQVLVSSNNTNIPISTTSNSSSTVSKLPITVSTVNTVEVPVNNDNTLPSNSSLRITKPDNIPSINVSPLSPSLHSSSSTMNNNNNNQPTRSLSSVNMTSNTLIPPSSSTAINRVVNLSLDDTDEFDDELLNSETRQTPLKLPSSLSSSIVSGSIVQPVSKLSLSTNINNNATLSKVINKNYMNNDDEFDDFDDHDYSITNTNNVSTLGNTNTNTKPITNNNNTTTNTYTNNVFSPSGMSQSLTSSININNISSISLSNSLRRTTINNNINYSMYSQSNEEINVDEFE